MLHMSNEVYCRVYGRVQLVMFRDYTQRMATKLGIVGTVKNLPDGTVEAIGQGTKEQLEQFVVKIKKGSFLSRVDKVEVIERQPQTSFSKFKIVYE